MSDLEFMTLTRVVMGAGVLDRIGAEAAAAQGTRVLVITDPGVRQAGVVELVVGPLEAAGLFVAVFDDVVGNPTVDNVVAGQAACKSAAADLIVAVGGGSAIDAAKAVAILATNGGEIADYEGFERLPIQPLPLFAVPTTVGTGSEVTKGAVISNPAQHHKIIVVSKMMYPALAFLDPRAVSKLPSHICAATGLDALTHAIEGYVATGANAYSDALNRQAITIIGRHLRAAVAGDPDALHQMQLAASLAGTGFHNAGLGLVHALANTLGGHFPIHHGATNGVLLPHVMAFNAVAVPQRFADIARELGQDVSGLDDAGAAKCAVAGVTRLMSDVKTPATLRELSIPEDVLPRIATEALDHIDRPANPRANDVKDLESILRAAF